MDKGLLDSLDYSEEVLDTNNINLQQDNESSEQNYQVNTERDNDDQNKSFNIDLHKEIKDGADIEIITTSIENNNDNSTIRKFINKIKNLNKKKLLVGFLIINLGFPLYLSYNNPTSMVKIFDNHYGIDTREFNYLYSIYAIPNLVLVFLGGVLVDIYGPEKCSLIFNFIMTLSTILAALSATPPRYGLLLFSRLVLGIGGETILVCVSCFMAKWFTPKEMPIIVALGSTWVQFGSLLAFGALPTIYNHTNFPFTLWFVAIIGVLSFICNITFVYFGKTKLYYEKIQDEKEMLIDSKEEEKEIEDESGDIKLQDININENENDIILTTINNSNEENTKKKLEFDVFIAFKEFKKAILLVRLIPTRMWVLVGISFFGYSSFYGLDIIATDMIIEKYGYSETKAALIMASETFANGICCPLFPLVSKLLRKRSISLAVGSIVMGVGILIVVFTSSTPLPWIIICGLGYGLVNNTLISTIPVIVDESIIGTAYGLVGVSYNAGIVIYPLFLSYFRVQTGNYNFSMIILVFSALFALLFTIVLKKLDLKSTNKID